MKIRTTILLYSGGDIYIVVCMNRNGHSATLPLPESCSPGLCAIVWSKSNSKGNVQWVCRCY